MKLVIRESIALKLYPGYMNISVKPEHSLNTLYLFIIVSNVLVVVVPTLIILPFYYLIFVQFLYS